MKRLFLICLVNLAVLEIAFRLFNSFYPIIRPADLADTFQNRWLEGYDWRNGLTRLYIYQPTPGARTYGHPFNVNSYGFRGKEFKDRAAEGRETFRIMVLGDSMTMGQGVAQEDRFTDVLERRLQAQYSGRKIEVINLGVQGYETVQEEKILKRMWPIVEPDLTIVAFCGNDTDITYEHDQPHRLPIPDGRKRTLLEHSLIFRLVDTKLYNLIYRALTREPSALDEMIASYNPESRDWRVFEQSVTSIGEFVRAKTGKPPLVFEVEDLSGFRGGVRTAAEWKTREYYPKVRAVFERAGFTWIDLDDNFTYREISRFELHPNEATHAGYAEALFKGIVSRGLIAQSSLPPPH